MKKILLSSLMVIAIGGVTIGATTAYFSDVETSTGNTFTAGAVDLQVDNSAWYNGNFVREMSWAQTNLTIQKFFNLLDVKPGDWEEDTISLHVDNNDAWMCMDITLTSNDDVDSEEPELGAGDILDVDADLYDGELAQNINSIWWADDGDNVLESNETIIKSGTLKDLASTTITLADSNVNIWNVNGGPVPAESVRYIGKAFCFGTLTPSPVPAGQGINPGVATGFICDGKMLGNITQSDTLTADLRFEAVQSRNNPKFTCKPGELGCLGKADVMLVMDRSGSIDDAEMATMKTAAKAFVDALNPQTDGVHIGLASFSSTGSLDENLTSDGSAVKADIDALVGSGLTNLYDGLAIAGDQLDATTTNNYIGFDRNDADSPDVIVVMTDGNPNQPGNDVAYAKAVAAAEAANLDLNNVKIYVVGIGADVDGTYLTTDIATGPAFYFPAANFSDLSTVLADIASCSQDQ